MFASVAFITTSVCDTTYPWAKVKIITEWNCLLFFHKVDALKARLKIVEDENAALRTKNVQLLGGLDILRKHQIPLENTSEVEFVNQVL